jgi:hypothetical protein
MLLSEMNRWNRLARWLSVLLSISNMRSDRAGAITSVNREMISAMPTITRSMNDIMRLSPQSNTTSNGFAVGGGNYRQSYVTVDGAAYQ